VRERFFTIASLEHQGVCGSLVMAISQLNFTLMAGAFCAQMMPSKSFGVVSRATKKSPDAPATEFMHSLRNTFVSRGDPHFPEDL